MGVGTKSKNSILAVLKNMFSSEPDIEDYEDVKLSPELEETLKSLKEQEDKAEQAINVDSKKSSNGGFAQKVDTKELDSRMQKMREIHDKVRTDEERGER